MKNISDFVTWCYEGNKIVVLMKIDGDETVISRDQNSGVFSIGPVDGNLIPEQDPPKKNTSGKIMFKEMVAIDGLVKMLYSDQTLIRIDLLTESYICFYPNNERRFSVTTNKS